MVDGFALLAAVGGSLQNGAQQNGVGPGEEAGNKVDLLGIVLMLTDQIPNQIGPQILDLHCPFVTQGLTAAVARGGEHHLTDILTVFALIVGIQHLGKLCVSHTLFFVDALLAGGKAVGNHGDTAAVDTHIVVVGTTVGDVDTLLDEAVLEQIEDQFGLALGLVGQMVDDTGAGSIYGDLQMLLILSPQRIDVGSTASAAAIISSKATSKTLARFTLTVSFMVYSMPGMHIQWQPAATRRRASSLS